MKHCSCGSSAITVTPNRTASGWGPFSYTYTCRRCGATVSATTLDETRDKWDARMSKEQVRWETSIEFDDQPPQTTVFDTVDDLINFITTDYRSIKTLSFDKRVTRKGRA